MTPVNDPPVAVDDAATTDEGVARSTSPCSRTRHDVEGDALTVTAFTQPAAGQGTVTQIAGTLRYAPPARILGTATFWYTVLRQGRRGHGYRLGDRPAGERRADGGERSRPQSPRTASSSSTRGSNDLAGPANESGRDPRPHHSSVSPRTGPPGRAEAASSSTGLRELLRARLRRLWGVDDGTTAGAPDPKCADATIHSR